MISDVYIIKGPEDKIYIGSSVDIKQRFVDHKKRLRIYSSEIHHCMALQQAWIKYGEHQFKFEVLEYCSSDKLIEREQHYLDLYKDLLYNTSPSAGSRAGSNHDEISKDAMRLNAR